MSKVYKTSAMYRFDEKISHSFGDRWHKEETTIIRTLNIKKTNREIGNAIAILLSGIEEQIKDIKIKQNPKIEAYDIFVEVVENENESK